jgi:hypothetical protein
VVTVHKLGQNCACYSYDKERKLVDLNLTLVKQMFLVREITAVPSFLGRATKCFRETKKGKS